MVEKSKRDLYYDLWKGVAALNVVIIHTTYWSGLSYVPDFVRDMVLIIDVPLFFFCSGACQHYVKSIGKQICSLANLYLKWIMFLPIYYIVSLLAGGSISKGEIVRNLLFSGTGNSAMPVVIGSTWFWPIYFIVSFCGCIAIKKSLDVKKLLFGIIGCYAICLLTWHITNNDIAKQFVKIFFYSSIFLLGYMSYSHKVPMVLFTIGETLAIGISLLSIFNVVTPMSEAKAPPIITYAAFSLIVIILVAFYKRPIRQKNLLTWVGQNCLMFYFAQGISSSLLYFILPAFVGWNWLLKYLCCIIINIGLVLIISLVLKQYYAIIYEGIKRIKLIGSRKNNF